MRDDLLPLLACPEDKAPLTLDVTAQENDDIRQGTLTCTQCGFAYPIEDGVPNLLPQAMHTDGVTDAE